MAIKKEDLHDNGIIQGKTQNKDEQPKTEGENASSPLLFSPEIKTAKDKDKNEKEKSKTLIKNVVFDFDKTMVNGHFHNYFIDKDTDPDEFAKTAKTERSKIWSQMLYAVKEPWAKNPQELKATIQMLIDNDIQLGIVSFTEYPATIQIFLEGLLGKELSVKGTPYIDHFTFGHNIIARMPGDEEMDKFGKNPFIQEFLKNVKAKAEETLFADDDPENRKLAAEVLPSDNIIVVPESPIRKYDPNKMGDEVPRGYHFLRDIREKCGLGAAPIEQMVAERSKPM